MNVTALLLTVALVSQNLPPVETPELDPGLVSITQSESSYGFNIHAHHPEYGVTPNPGFRVVWTIEEWWGGTVYTRDWRVVTSEGYYLQNIPIPSNLPDQCLVTAWLEVSFRDPVTGAFGEFQHTGVGMGSYIYDYGN